MILVIILLFVISFVLAIWKEFKPYITGKGLVPKEKALKSLDDMLSTLDDIEDKLNKK